MWKTIKRLVWQVRGIWIVTPSVAGLVILIRFFGLLQSWEWAVFDQYIRLRPQKTLDNRIVIVGIDEEDLQQANHFIISDASLAKLLNKLKAMQPRTIGLDVYRDLPEEPGHQALIEVFKSTPNLIGIQKVVGKPGLETVAPPPILAAQGQVGANDLIYDGDNKVRRSFLYITDNQSKKDIWSFSTYLALHYLDAKGITLDEVPGKKDTYKLGKAVFTPFTANDGGYVGADDKGYQILINYRGSRGKFDMVPMRDILKDKVPANWGRDRIILIGYVGETSRDLFLTPYSSGLFTSPEPMSGVEIHANLTSQMINSALEDSTLFKSWNESIEWIWIVLWSGIGATLTWQLRDTSGIKYASLRRWISLILMGFILISGTYAAILYHWWLPVVPPFLALTGSIFIITAYIARTAGEIRKIFGRYLTDQVVANLLETPEGLKLGGERRKITILTSDLRGFTTLSETLQPEEVVKILNFYLESMANEITNYQGTIDEFMGDGILVLFGAPTIRKNDAAKAIACSIAMQSAMVKVNEQMKQWKLPQLEMGIAVNTGIVIVGNIGSVKRSKYGVVGSQVNLTYRIESYTTGGQIFISESTLQEAGEIVTIRGQKQVQPKGVKGPITIYEVAGIGGEYNLVLPQEEEVLFDILEPIPVHYTILSEKHIGNSIFQGRLVKLSTKGAEIYSENQEEASIPPGMSNIKLNLLTPQNTEEFSEDIYGKIVAKQTDKGNFYICFTAKTPEVSAKLDSLINEIINQEQR